MDKVTDEDVEHFKLKRGEHFNGWYRGMGFKITHYPTGPSLYGVVKDGWCFYLYFHKEAFNDKKTWMKISRNVNKYFKSPLSNIEWHHGMSWCETHPKYIEGGCDFQHSWDDDHGSYDLSDVTREVYRAIDSVFEIFLDFKVQCHEDHSFWKPEDGLIIEGRFTSEKNGAGKKYYEKHRKEAPTA